MTETPVEFIEVYILFKVPNGAHKEGPYRVTKDVFESMMVAFRNSSTTEGFSTHAKTYDAIAIDTKRNETFKRPTKLLIRFSDVLMIG